MLHSVFQAIALFNADQCEEAMLLIKELGAVYPNTDTLARRVVEAYLRVELGTKALGDARHDEAADHFTAAVNSSAISSKIIHLIYEDLTVVRQDDAYTILFITECFVPLFGWDLESLCLIAHQRRCQAFLSAGKSDEALGAHKCMMDAIDETAKASCLDWSNEFKEQCSALAAPDDRILGLPQVTIHFNSTLPRRRHYRSCFTIEGHEIIEEEMIHAAALFNSTILSLSSFLAIPTHP